MLENETSHGPEKITDDNVQFWSKHTKELKNTQVNKALQFVKYDCLHYIGDDNEYKSKYTFICLPLNKEEEWVEGHRTFLKKPFPKDYNHSAYKIYKSSHGAFECACQGWQTKLKRGEIIVDGANCSHVLALYYCFRLRRFGNDAHPVGQLHTTDGKGLPSGKGLGDKETKIGVI